MSKILVLLLVIATAAAGAYLLTGDKEAPPAPQAAQPSPDTNPADIVVEKPADVPVVPAENAPAPTPQAEQAAGVELQPAVPEEVAPVVAAPITKPHHHHTGKKTRALASAAPKHKAKPNDTIDLTQLSPTAGADDTNTQKLLFMWGPRPTPAQMALIEARYEHAQGAEKEKWANIYSNHADSDTLVAFVGRHPETMGYTLVATDYFRALAYNGDLAASAEQYKIDAQKTHDTTILQLYAHAAQENSFLPQARDAWEMVVIIDPANSTALREAGIIAYQQKDYTASELYLGEYVRIQNVVADNGAYLALFDYAQLMRRHRQTEQADHYYKAAMESIAKQGLKTPEALSVNAQSQVWLGDVAGGMRGFKTARETYPDNDALRADLIDTLTQLREYDEARHLLATPPGAAYDATETAIELPSDYSGLQSLSLLSQNHELLVRLAQPVAQGGTPIVDTFKNAAWVGETRQGYDSILVIAKPGYRFAFGTSEGDPKAIMVVTDKDSAAYRDSRQMALRYEFLAARIDQDTGHIYASAKRLNGLMPEYKGDAPLLGFAADAENDGGNWPRAEKLLKTATAIAPENEDISGLNRDMRRQYAQNVALDYDWLHRGSDHESIETLEGLLNANDYVQRGISLQNDDVQLKHARLANGQVGDFSRNRQQGEIYVQRSEENGELIKASLFANNNSPGLGAYYHFLSDAGETQLSGEWHRPYWGLAEGVYQSAERDRAAFLHTIKPMPELTISAGGGINNYSVDSAKNVLSTASAELNAIYRLFDNDPILAIGYGLDAEYRLASEKGIDATGARTPLFNLETREVHSLFVNSKYDFAKDTYGDIKAGYQYDRLGDNNPFVEAKLTYELTHTLDAQLRAYYGLDTVDTRNNETSVGGRLRWRFN